MLNLDPALEVTPQMVEARHYALDVVSARSGVALLFQVPKLLIFTMMPFEPQDPYLAVTPEMIDAGFEELCQHHHGEDMRAVLEAVFYAMVHASRPRASATISDK